MNVLHHYKYIKGLLKNPFSAIPLIMLIYMLSGCIALFEPPEEIKAITGILVVEGVIVEEGTTISLKKTIKLDERDLAETYLFAELNRAVIQIIDEQDNVIAVAEQETNYAPYIVKEKITFVPGMKYALDIRTIDNKHYRSAFVEPADTPEIDEVTYQVKEDRSIDIMVSTHDPTNETLYCLWDFEENWEVRSPYFQSIRYESNTGELIQQNINGENRYYCWASLVNRSLMLGSSEKFEASVIKNYKIHTLQPGTSRYSYLYSINVTQYRLNRDAYLYFSNLQRNIEDSGSLFAPQPSEMTGNMQCLSDPDETVIGYILATKATTSRLFIPMTEINLHYFDDIYNYGCTEIEYDIIYDGFRFGYAFVTTTVNGRYLFVSGFCADCMQRGLGNPTKTKPAYWPNDHQ